MRMIIISNTAIAASILFLSACGSTEAETNTVSATASASASETPAVSTAQAEAQTRVSVTYESGVEVFSLLDNQFTSLAEFPTEAEVRAVAGPDARHLYLVDGANSLTTVLDTGSYAQGHGDHSHFYTREPEMRPDVIEGDVPVHVIGHDGRVAIFNDGDGTVDVFDEIGLTSGGLRVAEAAAELPHHGVAVPIESGLLLTESSDGELPSSIRQTDLDGETVKTYQDACVGLHGEASVDSLVVFGCQDSITVIDPQQQTATSIPNPTDAGEGRIGAFYAGGHTLVGGWNASAFTVIHLDEQEISVVDTDAPVAAITRGDEGEIIVLSTDGVVTVHDDHGNVVGSTAAIDAFTLPEGHGTQRPALAVAGETLIVSDHAGMQLVTIDLHDYAVTSQHPLEEAPVGIVVTGLAPVAETHDDHADEEGEHQDDEDEDSDSHEGHDH
ncbi:hypothetical protein [Demequina aurantiaca]|uniref:hypothetical protein n=1 Tax=Demequina aurantiaca TaxID=676200 RepID=UPI003D334487